MFRAEGNLWSTSTAMSVALPEIIAQDKCGAKKIEAMKIHALFVCLFFFSCSQARTTITKVNSNFFDVQFSCHFCLSDIIRQLIG